jgi:hypothetical protein
VLSAPRATPGLAGLEGALCQRHSGVTHRTCNGLVSHARDRCTSTGLRLSGCAQVCALRYSALTAPLVVLNLCNSYPLSPAWRPYGFWRC